MTEYDNIELRSEKVRNIIGRVPPELVTGGTVYIAFLLFCLFIATVIIPFPENIRTGVVVTNMDSRHVTMEALIPYRYINRIERGADIYVEMEGYTAREYGYNIGRVGLIEDSVISRNGNNYFRAHLMLKAPFKYELKWNMQGNATITIADNSILLYLLKKEGM